MALIGNYSVYNKSPGKWGAGNSTAHATGICSGAVPKTRSAFNLPSDWRKFNWVDESGGTFATLVKTAARPRGYYPQGAFALPSVTGEMALDMTGAGSVTLTLYPSKLMVAALSGSGDLAATAGLVISMSLAMTGSGTLTATIIGDLDMTLAMTGSGTLAAAMEADGNMTLPLTGSGTLSAVISAFGDMELDIVVTGTGLTIENVAGAVWNALAASYDAPDTMGEQLNAAGAGGNPWLQVIESGLTAEEVLRLILASAALKTSGPVPGEAGTFTIRNVADTLDRITATVDASGNRTAVTLDPS